MRSLPTLLQIGPHMQPMAEHHMLDAKTPVVRTHSLHRTEACIKLSPPVLHALAWHPCPAIHISSCPHLAARAWLKLNAVQVLPEDWSQAMQQAGPPCSARSGLGPPTSIFTQLPALHSQAFEAVAAVLARLHTGSTPLSGAAAEAAAAAAAYARLGAPPAGHRLKRPKYAARQCQT